MVASGGYISDKADCSGGKNLF